MIASVRSCKAEIFRSSCFFIVKQQVSLLKWICSNCFTHKYCAAFWAPIIKLSQTVLSTNGTSYSSYQNSNTRIVSSVKFTDVTAVSGGVSPCNIKSCETIILTYQCVSGAVDTLQNNHVSNERQHKRLPQQLFMVCYYQLLLSRLKLSLSGCVYVCWWRSIFSVNCYIGNSAVPKYKRLKGPKLI